jgi:hypothetical protein
VGKDKADRSAPLVLSSAVRGRLLPQVSRIRPVIRGSKTNATARSNRTTIPLAEPLDGLDPPVDDSTITASGLRVLFSRPIAVASPRSPRSTRHSGLRGRLRLDL